jgi:hypothetical protein
MAFDLDSYNTVADRIAQFRDLHPYGSLQSEIVLLPTEALPFVVVKAFAYRDAGDERPGIGLAWEPFPGKTSFTRDSELQNAETSAWGRAIIAALAADTKKGIASADEIRARRSGPEAPRTAAPLGGPDVAPESRPSPTGATEGASGGLSGAPSPSSASGAGAEGKNQTDNKADPPSTGISTAAPSEVQGNKGVEPDATGKGGLGSTPDLLAKASALYGTESRVLRAARLIQDFNTADEIDAATLAGLIARKSA